MGNLIITDTDFSFEFTTAEDTDPTSAASCPEQAILQALQHYNEDFFFSFTTKKYMTPRSQAMIIG